MNLRQLIKNIFFLLLFWFSASCQERKSEKHKDSVSPKNPELVIINGKLDSLSPKDNGKNLKELIPESKAVKTTFKTREEYENWRDSIDQIQLTK